MQNARPLCKKVQPMPVTIFRASVLGKCVGGRARNLPNNYPDRSRKLPNNYPDRSRKRKRGARKGQEKGKNYQAANKKLLPDSAWLK